MRLARDAAKPSKVVTGTIATVWAKFYEHAPPNMLRPTTKFPTMKMPTPLVSPHILPKTLRTFLNIWLQTLLTLGAGQNTPGKVLCQYLDSIPKYISILKKNDFDNILNN